MHIHCLCFRSFCAGHAGGYAEHRIECSAAVGAQALIQHVLPILLGGWGWVPIFVGCIRVEDSW